MRALAWMMALAAIATGCDTAKCKDKTVLVTTTFDAAARAAQTLLVVVELDGNARPAVTIPGPRGHESGTIQVEFPSGYHEGSTLSVTVSAQLAGQVAQGSASTRLVAGCTTMTVAVKAGSGDGVDLSDTTPPDMTMVPDPVVTAKPDLVGFVTSLDGSGSTDPLGSSLTFAWAIEQAPAGSQIKTASLTSTTATKTSFEPDLGGLYKVALTVTASDGRAATKTVDVTVPTAPILYFNGTTTATTVSIGTRVIASDGTGDRNVACQLSADGGLDRSSQPQFAFIGHAWEPPTGMGTPQFVFLGLQDVSANMPPQLLVATPQTNCTTSPPARVDNNIFSDHVPISARFSPDGKRIVYVDMPQNTNDGSYRLVSVSADGTGAMHVIRTSGNFPTTPPIWLDNQTVAWMEWDDSNYKPFTLYKAPDETAAGEPSSTKRAQVLHCDQSTNATHLYGINQFEVSPFGMIVSGNTDPRCTVLCNPPYAAVSMYRLASGDCSVTNAKTLASEPRGGLSWDFTLSPDGLTILFSSTHGQDIPDGGLPTPQSDIFLVPSDGSAPPHKIVGDPLYDDIGPRYIAGGRQFIWSRAPRGLDMGADTPTIMIANADGTHVRALNPPVGPGETLALAHVGVNRGFECSWTPGSAAVPATGVLLGLGLLLLAYVTSRSRGRR
jgi:WD40-like Beta Propeller Repeat